MKKINGKLKKLLQIIKNPELEILPGHLAFFLVLSLVPILTIFVIIASRFSLSVEILINFINTSLPKNIGDMLRPIVDGRGLDFNVSFFMIVSFIIASNGLYSVIVSVNTLYKMKEANYINRRVKSLILMIIMVFLFLFILVVMAFGNNIVLFVSQFIKSDYILKFIYYLYLLLKWPIGFVLILFAINLIYTIAPDVKVKSHNSLKGSLFTTLSWILATLVFSYYVDNFANYDIVYGSLSNLVVMMMWVYMLAYLFVIGIAINVYFFEMDKSANYINEKIDNNNKEI